MIGGVDIHLPTNAGDTSMEAAVRAVRQFWSSAVFENGITGQRYDHFRDIPFGEIEELFVYRDEKSADEWDTEGAVPRLYNTMIHIVRDDDMVTIVVDEKDAEMQVLIGAIQSALDDEILCIPAELGAA